MIIDALAHITGDGAWFDTGLDASLGALVARMARDGVDKAVLVGLPLQNNDAAIVQAVREHPGKFIPVAGVDASLGAASLMRRMEEVKALGFAGIKVHPRLSRVPLTHPGIKNAVKLAGDLDLTAMICSVHRPPLAPLGRPVSDALYDLCRECDTTRIILVHGGYTDILATSELIRPLEHVLLDLSLTLPRFRSTSLGLDMAWLVDSFDRRICVGSDFPEADMAIVAASLKEIGVDAVETMGRMSGNLLKMFPSACSS